MYFIVCRCFCCLSVCVYVLLAIQGLIANERLREVCYQLMNIQPLSDQVDYGEKATLKSEDAESKMVDEPSQISLDRTYPEGYCT